MRSSDIQCRVYGVFWWLYIEGTLLNEMISPVAAYPKKCTNHVSRPHENKGVIYQVPCGNSIWPQKTMLCIYPCSTQTLLAVRNNQHVQSLVARYETLITTEARPMFISATTESQWYRTKSLQYTGYNTLIHCRVEMLAPIAHMADMGVKTTVCSFQMTISIGILVQLDAKPIFGLQQVT